MRNHVIFMTVICIFLLQGCYVEKLTEKTQIGTNTFSCKINGVTYQARSDFFGKGVTSIIISDYLDHSENLSIISRGPQYKPARSLSLFLINFTIGKRIYLLDDSNYCEVSFFKPDIYYSTKKTKLGKIEITKYDPEKHICAGVFDFVAINKEDPNDKIYVTEGRFDTYIK